MTSPFDTPDLPIVNDFRALLSGETWSGYRVAKKPVFVTFSFDTKAQDYLQDYGFSKAYADSFRALSKSEKAAALKALNIWGATSGIHFLQVDPGKGDIRLGSYNFDKGPADSRDAAGYAYYPDVSIDKYSGSVSDIGGDVFLDYSTRQYSADDYMKVLLHEIGHAIGLKHPHEGLPFIFPHADNGANTVMTYNDYEGHLGKFDYGAARFLYGRASTDGDHLARWSWNAASDTLTQIGKEAKDTIKGVSTADIMSGRGGNDILFGAEGDDRLDGGKGNDSLLGGDGIDTADYSSANGKLTIDLNGDYVFSGGSYVFFHARGSSTGTDTFRSIEKVIGGRSGDSITGDGGDNQLEGRGGNDAIHGGLGKDRLDGGSGTDSLEGGSGLDTFVFSTKFAAAGVDTITDFLTGRDTIALAHDVFNVLGLGNLRATAFEVGVEAGDSLHHIVYDDVTGALYYDADGAGGRAQVQFAQLEADLDLRVRDFVIV